VGAAGGPTDAVCRLWRAGWSESLGLERMKKTAPTESASSIIDASQEARTGTLGYPTEQRWHEAMKPRWNLSTSAVALLLAALLPASSALAGVIQIGPFAGPTPITFTGLADSTEVSGLTVSGVLFTYTVGGSPLAGAVIIDGGPGTTNNIAPPNIVSVGDNSGTLSMLLPSPATMFGYGYAILTTSPVADATTISVFSGATLLGSLSYAGLPDPQFTGGFAGIQSTIPFDRVEVVFNSSAAGAFALDNIVSNIPEPSTMFLVLTSGIAGLLWRRRRARKTASAD